MRTNIWPSTPSVSALPGDFLTVREPARKMHTSSTIFTGAQQYYFRTDYHALTQSGGRTGHIHAASRSCFDEPAPLRERQRTAPPALAARAVPTALAVVAARVAAARATAGVWRLGAALRRAGLLAPIGTRVRRRSPGRQDQTIKPGG
eukprot:7200095-Prymnesium_polylepis.1